jgi:hypothetical protein
MFGHVFNQLASYVESQVEESERARIERHLASCEQCRAALQRIRAGVALAATLTPERMPHDVVTRIRAATQSGDGRTHRRLPVTALWRAAAVLAAGLVAAANAPTRIAREGRSLHEQIKSGTVAMSYTAEDEADLWQWLAREGAPVTSMQVTRTPSERAQFVPLGASVRTLGGAQSSVLAYRIDGRPVTLVLANSGDIPDAPAPGLWSKRVLHRAEANGANTLTWTVGGGTYVMVSELGGAGQRACLICHTSPRFEAALQRLSSRARLDRQ